MHMVISYVKAGYVLTYFYCYKIPVVRCALEVHVPLALFFLLQCLQLKKR